MRLFNVLSLGTDTEWSFIDVSYVKAHQHGTGAASEQLQVVSLNRGGNTSKIHLAVDSDGLSIEFIVIGGEVHDSKAANKLIDLLPQTTYIIADKGDNSEVIRNRVRGCDSVPVISRKKNSKVGNDDTD